MAASIPKVDVTNVWQSVSSLTGIAAGTAIKIQHTGGYFVDVAISALAPVEGGAGIGEEMRTKDFFVVASGEAEVWVKTSSPCNGASARLSIQENA